MDLYEYMGKDLFRAHAIATPRGIVATSAEEAAAATRELGGRSVVKVQVQVGGRGKGGGVVGATAYASDSGDQITIWVPSEAIRRHLDSHYREAIARRAHGAGTAYTHVRLVVSGFEDDDIEDE